MTFSIDDLVKNIDKHVQEDNANEPEHEAPDSISINPNTPLKSMNAVSVKELFLGVPTDTSNLFVKFSGNCTYFPYNPNKSVTILPEQQDIHFRFGQKGRLHLVLVPAGS